MLEKPETLVYIKKAHSKEEGEYKVGVFKEFYGTTTINEEELKKAGKNDKIELDYYKIKNTMISENFNNYGVEIVKKQIRNNCVNIETKEIIKLTKNEKIADELLDLLKNYQVTPITLEDVIQDFRYKKYNNI